MLQHGDDAESSGHNEEFEDASRLLKGSIAEKAKLYLPSQIPPSLWGTGCMPGLRETELKLQIAQASDALEQLKHHLCVHSSFIHYKIKQVSGPGQKANTHARNILGRLREKFTRSAEKYRVSCATLVLLDPTGDCNEYLKPLLPSDLKGPNGNSPDDLVASMSKRSKPSRGNSEGFREVSWIWRVRRRVSPTNGELASIEGSRLMSELDLDKYEYLNSKEPCIECNRYNQV